jgi:DNA-nicking Smr family endonuclease
MANPKKKESFGDILKKWESGIDNSQKHLVDEWLCNNKIYNRDDDFSKTAVPRKNRQKLLRNRPDAILDVHGLTSEGGWLSLEHFFNDAKNRGYTKLRIIHGKGNHSQGDSVLRSVVRKFIEKCPFAGESGYEKAANGGSGVTWVLLKTDRK